MSDPIPPALTPDEWKDVERTGATSGPLILGELPYIADNDPVNMARVMAVANSLLEPDSPYKITRQKVELLRDAVIEQSAETVDEQSTRELHAFADALAALLPPE